MNLNYKWPMGSQANVSGTPISIATIVCQESRCFGGSYGWGDDRFTLYTVVSGNTAIVGNGRRYNLKGAAGFRVRF